MGFEYMEVVLIKKRLLLRQRKCPEREREREREREKIWRQLDPSETKNNFFF